MSMHGIKNAWQDIIFCDPTRGLFGALCADILHCLQHGLFVYAHQELFSSKQAKSNKKQTLNDSEDLLQTDFGNKNVFSKLYNKRFENLASKYGYYLSHQSDRDLPRTHLYSNYTTTTRKTANEMSGVLLVILIIFMTNEGETKLDQAMKDIQISKFIHLLELLLMLENFCLSAEHRVTDIKKFKKFIPFFLNTYKETLNRQQGNGCKLIKFHLLNHFGDDMLRFGSMLNYDTEIGESHHKSEAKHPAKNTQRRKAEFEFQTATRQIENLAIDVGIRNIQNNSKIEASKASQERNQNKWFRYMFNEERGLHYRKTKKNCNWKDKIFQSQLIEICKEVTQKQYLEGDLNFFSLHKRDNSIFRADPNFKPREPWYDWVQIQWADEIIPGKLLLFWNISKDQFNKPFRIGTSLISNPGNYVFLYSLKTASLMEPAHLTSSLLKYGSLEVATDHSPIINIIEVDCINSTISGIPYKTEDNIVNAIEWIFLQPKNEWYKIFIDIIDNTVSTYATQNENMTINNKRKKKK